MCLGHIKFSNVNILLKQIFSLKTKNLIRCGIQLVSTVKNQSKNLNIAKYQSIEISTVKYKKVLQQVLQ